MSDQPKEKVVPLFANAAITGERTPIPGVIEQAERLLDMARAGEIVGLASAYTYHDGASGQGWVGKVNRSTIGALTEMTFDICKA